MKRHLVIGDGLSSWASELVDAAPAQRRVDLTVAGSKPPDHEAGERGAREEGVDEDAGLAVCKVHAGCSVERAGNHVPNVSTQMVCCRSKLV